MIGEFPSFNPLQIGDRQSVQRLTRRYPPYSDFNFTSLYSWDTNEAVRVSVLNDNLVVRFTDYTTNEPFYSFLGDNAVDDTTRKLLELAQSEGIAPELRLIPEVSAWRVTPGEFVMREDDDNFDYILAIDRLKNYQGNKLGPKRNFVNRFNKAYEAATVQVDLSDVAIQTRFFDLFHRWLIQKGDTAENAENELLALHRVMFAARSLPDLYVVATFIGDDLAGFSINEILGNGYAMIHFEKADSSYTGIYARLMQQMATLMSAKGCNYINYEQDLGLPGLRKGKSSYIPANYLRKYALRFATASTRPEAIVGIDNLSAYSLISGIPQARLPGAALFTSPLAPGEWTDSVRAENLPGPEPSSIPSGPESVLPSSRARYSIPPSDINLGLNLPPMYAGALAGPPTPILPESMPPPAGAQSRPPVRERPLGGYLDHPSSIDELAPKSVRASKPPQREARIARAPTPSGLQAPLMPRIPGFGADEQGDAKPSTARSPGTSPPQMRNSYILPPAPQGPPSGAPAPLQARMQTLPPPPPADASPSEVPPSSRPDPSLGTGRKPLPPLPREEPGDGQIDAAQRSSRHVWNTAFEGPPRLATPVSGARVQRDDRAPAAVTAATPERKEGSGRHVWVEAARVATPPGGARAPRDSDAVTATGDGIPRDIASRSGRLIWGPPVAPPQAPSPEAAPPDAFKASPPAAGARAPSDTAAPRSSQAHGAVGLRLAPLSPQRWEDEDTVDASAERRPTHAPSKRPPTNTPGPLSLRVPPLIPDRWLDDKETNSASEPPPHDG